MTSKSQNQLLPPLWVITISLLVLSLWLVYELKEMLVLFVLGYCIAFVMNPLLNRLENFGVNRARGFFVVSFLFLLLIGLLAVSAIPQLSSNFRDLSNKFPIYLEKFKVEWIPFLTDKISHLPFLPGDLRGEFEQAIPDVGPSALKGVLSGILATLLKGYSLTLTIVNLFLLPFVAFYIAVDFKDIHRNGLKLFPKAQRKVVREMGEQINDSLSAFVSGQFIVASVLAALYSVGLALVGLDLWFLLALLAGYLQFVPYLGFAVGIVSCSIMSLLTYGDFFHLLLVWLVFAVVQALESFVITPKVIGDKVGISPLMVILAIFAGGKLFGLLGVFLAVPGAAVLKVISAKFHKSVILRPA